MSRGVGARVDTAAGGARRRAAGPGAALALGCLVLLGGCAGWHVASRALLAPPAPVVECASAAVVGLTWEPVRGGRPALYRVMRDGQVLGSSMEPRFVDASVAAETTYRYTVSMAGATGVAGATRMGGATGDALDSAPLSVSTPPAGINGDAPYCPSRVIAAMDWDWAQGYRAAGGSDLWPVTWGQDGSVYAFFGDGGGFGGDDHLGRTSFGIAKITGRPPPDAAQESNVYGGLHAAYPASISGKARALIAIDGDFYAIAGIYAPGDKRYGQPQPVAGSPDHLELLYSPHGAHDWRVSDWRFCETQSQPSDAAFCPSGFVNAGPGNRAHAGGADGFVYLFGSSPAADLREPDAAPFGRTFLARVDRRRLRSPQAYEYFAGLVGGTPQWSRDVTRMQPVFVDRNAPRPGCGGQCGMAGNLEEAVYDPGLGRYLGIAQADRVAQTSFYDAPHPWGPWTTVEYHNIEAENGAGGWATLSAAAGESLGVHPVTAWTSRDGRTLWMVYSSDGKAGPEAAFPPAGTVMDGFHLVRVELRLAGR